MPLSDSKNSCDGMFCVSGPGRSAAADPEVVLPGLPLCPGTAETVELPEEGCKKLVGENAIDEIVEMLHDRILVFLDIPDPIVPIFYNIESVEMFPDIGISGLIPVISIAIYDSENRIILLFHEIDLDGPVGCQLIDTALRGEPFRIVRIGHLEPILEVLFCEPVCKQEGEGDFGDNVILRRDYLQIFAALSGECHTARHVQT